MDDNTTFLLENCLIISDHNKELISVFGFWMEGMIYFGCLAFKKATLSRPNSAEVNELANIDEDSPAELCK